MDSIPEEVVQAWQQKEPAVIVTTVSKEGIPNSIYATCVAMDDDHRVVVADNYFSKTKANLDSGHPIAVLFITKDGKSYQIKGKEAYETDGPSFRFMKSWNPAKHPGHGALVITPESIYSGSRQLK